MAQNRAELIFVAGPQQGERSLLMTAAVVIGRHPSCDIQITEQTVSREQARFQLSPHGWVVASVASSPVRVNGRRYKIGQQIILETGDIVGVGLDTEMLFVAQGDDIEAALAEMREAHPQFAGFAGTVVGETPSEPAGPAPTPHAVPVQGLDLPTPPVPASQPEAMDLIVATEEETLAAEAVESDKQRKAKLLKYLVGFGIYGAVMVAVIAGIYVMRSGDALEDKEGPLKRLTDREIEKILTAELKARSRPQRAEGALNMARRFYDDFPQRPEAMYMAVKHFQIYLKFTKMKGFPNTADQALYQSAKNKLVESVTKVYRRAWKETKNEDWDAALRDFQHVQEMIPVQSEPYPDKDNGLFSNVRRYIRYIRKKTAKAPSRRF